MRALKGKSILITGGTGSFGNALIDSLENSDIKSIIVYSRDEKKQHDMLTYRTNKDINYVVGDVRDKDKLSKVLRDVDYVFHAAALKHVPTGEKFPNEVIKTNIIGTKNVIGAAEECGVKKVINLSTDKAVYPINAYGMSKALSEKLVSAHDGDTVFVNLRYGNVMGSRGSVIPLFLNQIKHKKPLTITNTEMTRFLLPLSNSVTLALKSLEEGKGGDLFVIKSPATKIGVLVEALELHFGKTFKKKIIGIRPGEKMHEALLNSEEVYRSKIMKENGIIFAKVQKLDADTRDYFSSGKDIKEKIESFTSANTIQYGPKKTLKMLKETGLL